MVYSVQNASDLTYRAVNLNDSTSKKKEQCYLKSQMKIKRKKKGKNLYLWDIAGILPDFGGITVMSVRELPFTTTEAPVRSFAYCL